MFTEPTPELATRQERHAGQTLQTTHVMGRIWNYTTSGHAFYDARFPPTFITNNGASDPRISSPLKIFLKINKGWDFFFFPKKIPSRCYPIHYVKTVMSRWSLVLLYRLQCPSSGDIGIVTCRGGHEPPNHATDRRAYPGARVAPLGSSPWTQGRSQRD
jgi:hypothetical protein